MAIIKCKMCGGDIELSPDKTFGTCDYCGSVMTLPKVDDDQRAAAFNRGNHFRRIGEFDKALAVYERIVAEDNTDAEAHWCCALCRFGIEYVEDPATYEFLPTCHRASFDSILEDVDYLAALEYSDGVTRRQYQKDGAKIAEVQRGILATSRKEEPFDVFICYKESDENGDRTVDSTLAQDIYYQLTEQGHRVFFSRITLEEKVGAEYEPYIFAALHSAKVMIAVGTRPENFSAVWVKNEWSRFLSLMKHDRSKVLLPCYRDMDPYDLPEQLSVLQSYNMSKIGFVQDLIRGVGKVLQQNESKPVAQETVMVQQTGGANTASLLKRGMMFLGDRDWTSANKYFERVLDMDPEYGQAYLGKLMSNYQVTDMKALEEFALELPEKSSYVHFMEFEDSEISRSLAETVRLAREKHLAEQEEARRHKKENDKERERIRQHLTAAQRILSAGVFHTVGVRSDGKAIVVGADKDEWGIKIGRCNVEGWGGLMAVSAGEKHTVGLRRDGTAVAVGDNYYDQCNVDGWSDLVAVSAGGKHTVGLRSDGTVVAAGAHMDSQCNVDGWRDIVAVSAGGKHTVGIRSDGTAVAVGIDGDGLCNVDSWSDLVAVSAGGKHTVGLRSDGTVVAAGENMDGQCNVDDWKDIVAVSAGYNHTVGLRSDGTAVAVGWNDYGQCNVDGWKDIVAVSAGAGYTVGLRSDGTVVAVGSNKDDRCNVNGWKLFDDLDTFAQEREELRQKVVEWRQAGLCPCCGGQFKGLFSKKCSVCGKPKDD